jgi:type IV secretory pathway VirB10-like protein
MKTSVEVGGRGSAETGGPSSPAAAPAAAPHGVANLGNGAGGGGFGGLFGGGFPGLGLGQTAQIDREGQEQKIDFAGQKGDLGKNDVVPTVGKPPDPYAVMAGSFVKFTTINEVNSDVPGSTIGMVTESVYNTSNGSCVLIPSGSKLIGHYNSVVSTGQSRLPGVLTRIIFPDGSSQAIGAMEMADNAGSAGMDDQINRHLIQKFGSAAIAGLFGAGIYLAVPHNTGFNNGIDATQIIGASLAQQIGQTGQQITQQNLSIPNTITIRAGYNGTMITDKDIHIQPWECDGSRGASVLPIMSVSQ